ncbi:unnamed protein product, partial [Rotaria sp. Silwood2]
RHERQRHDDHQTESILRHKYQSRSRSPDNHRSIITKHKENNVSNISQKSHPSSSPPPPPTAAANYEHKKNSRSYRYHHHSSPPDGFRSRHHRRSKSPPRSPSRVHSPSPPIIHQFKITHSQLHQKEYANIIHTNSETSSSRKRRKLRKNEEEFNEQQSLASIIRYTSLDNELCMIAQTSTTKLESSYYYPKFPQQSLGQTFVSESKWNDQNDMYGYLF